jgi:hypothetical protein
VCYGLLLTLGGFVVQVSGVEASQHKQKLYNSDPGSDLLLLTFLLLLSLLLLLLPLFSCTISISLCFTRIHNLNLLIPKLLLPHKLRPLIAIMFVMSLCVPLTISPNLPPSEFEEVVHALEGSARCFWDEEPSPQPANYGDCCEEPESSLGREAALRCV